MTALLEPLRRASGSHEVCRDATLALAPLSWASLLLFRYLQVGSCVSALHPYRMSSPSHGIAQVYRQLFWCTWSTHLAAGTS